jgi:RNA polymerase sigma-70 factor (sigma-E family)
VPGTFHGYRPAKAYNPGHRSIRVVSVSNRDWDFTAYYAARGPSVRNLAYLLCGRWHLAEDLTQTAFIKLYRVWGRVSKNDGMDAYVRQVLIRTFLDEQRRPWRREHSVEPDARVLGTATAPPPDVCLAVDLRRVLDTVPPRQRAVLILRFWLDLPVEQTAEVLGCSPGTVKSQTAHGLDRLRKALTSKEASDA